MSVRCSSILARQNEPSQMVLLRAMSVSHRRAQRLDLLRTTVAVGLAGCGVVAVFHPVVATAATMLGAAWAVVYVLGLASWSGSELRRAAVLQEMFDVCLFRLPWNNVLAGEPLATQEVSKLGRRYRGSEETLRSYYEIPDLPTPYDILACQYQNLGWGARIRRRYATTVLTLIGVWAGAGLAVGMATRLDVTALLLRWYIPSLAVLLVGLEICRGQRGVARDREHALSLLRDQITDALSRPHVPDTQVRTFARQVQDLIFQSRLRQTRVPDWFFLRFRSSDSADFRAAMAELEQRVGAAGRATDPVTPGR